MDPGGGRKDDVGVFRDALVVVRVGNVRVAGRATLEQLQPGRLLPVFHPRRHVEAEKDISPGEFFVRRLRQVLNVARKLLDVVKDDFVEDGLERIDHFGQVAVHERGRELELIGSHAGCLCAYGRIGSVCRSS